jgi:hypothetical protein
MLFGEGPGPGLEIFPELFALERKIAQYNGGVDIFILLAESFSEHLIGLLNVIQDVDFQEHFPHIVAICMLVLCAVLQGAIFEDSQVATFKSQLFIKSLIF